MKRIVSALSSVLWYLGLGDRKRTGQPYSPEGDNYRQTGGGGFHL
ncbi:hypothetical protein ACIPYS_31685 [Kitasatospora sp. NPDC089913]|nr:hypothetical protein [Streptomyces sp. TLI_053]SDS91414.1 hypothetical protein SAMN05216371_0879 [Streptomyces sp. TLI_053]